MPKVDISKAEPFAGSGYPGGLDAPCENRITRKLGEAAGLTQFGANLMTLKPGAWSSQRHHHSGEDEFVYIISGHPVLIDDAGETPLAPGDCTAHPAGDGNGHHMINRTDADVVFLVIGTHNSENDHCVYPDVDLDLPANGTKERVFSRKDGTPY